MAQWCLETWTQTPVPTHLVYVVFPIPYGLSPQL